jgi:hypothetical protein
MPLRADQKAFLGALTRIRRKMESATEHIAPDPRSQDSVLKAIVSIQFGYISLRDKGWSPESIQEFVEEWENQLQRRGVIKP